MQYTHQDVLNGKCEHWQVGTEIVHQVPSAIPTTPKDTVAIYLDVFHRMGGLDELTKFARQNPAKFYDQLLRLLIAMEAPKQTMQVVLRAENLTHAEIDLLPTHEIKRRLLASMSDVENVVENTVK